MGVFSKRRRTVTLHDGPVADFMSRWMQNPRDDELIRESGDWQWIADALEPGETRWVRCAVRFDGHDRRASKGFVFATDRRVFFCPRDRTDVFDLRDVLYIGPSRDNDGGYFQVDVAVAGGAAAVVMDTWSDDQISAFWPTLVHLVRQAKDSV